MADPMVTTPPPHEPTPAPAVTTLTAGTAPADAGSTGPDPSAGRVRYEPNGVEIGGGIAFLFLWAVIFGIGIVFPSDPFRIALTGKDGDATGWRIPAYLFIFLLTYTITNVAILCCISAWLGELGRRTRIDGAAQEGDFLRGDYLAAVMRGFLGYLAILTGFVVVGSGINLFVTPTPEGYIRLAAIVSLAGFLIGFNPAIFRRFEGTIVGKVTTETRAPDGTVEKKVVEGPATAVSPSPATPATPAAGSAPPAEATANGAVEKEPVLVP